MDDAQLAKFLGLDDDPRWPELIAKLPESKRATFERMAEVEMEIGLYQAGLGPLPKGVLIDWDRKAKRRP